MKDIRKQVCFEARHYFSNLNLILGPFAFGLCAASLCAPRPRCEDNTSAHFFREISFLPLRGFALEFLQ